MKSPACIRAALRRRLLVVALSLIASSTCASLAHQPQQQREPASRAAVVLTWDQAQREAGFAGMETIFLTRTVRASDRPRPLRDGRRLEAFAPGGLRANEFDRLVDGARIGRTSVVTDSWLPEATRTQVETGGVGSGYGYQWWTRPDGAFEGRGIYGQTLHIDRARRLVIAINSAAERPTGAGQGQARQDFIAAVKAEIDREKRRP